MQVYIPKSRLNVSFYLKKEKDIIRQYYTQSTSRMRFKAKQLKPKPFLGSTHNPIVLLCKSTRKKEIINDGKPVRFS